MFCLQCELGWREVERFQILLKLLIVVIDAGSKFKGDQYSGSVPTRFDAGLFQHLVVQR